MHLVFTTVLGERYRRRFRSLLLSVIALDIFQTGVTAIRW